MGLDPKTENTLTFDRYTHDDAAFTLSSGGMLNGWVKGHPVYFLTLLLAVVAALIASPASAETPDSLTVQFPSGETVVYTRSGQDPAPVPAAMISWPPPNEVIQQEADGWTGVALQWHGPADLVRVKRAAQVIAETATGQVDLQPGWYEGCLVTNGVEGHCIPFGVGDVYVVAGQSNAVSPLQPDTYALPPIPEGVVSLSMYYSPGGANTWMDRFRDAGTEPLGQGPGPYTAGVAWVFAALELNRPYPVGFVIVAHGNTSTEDWRTVYGATLMRAVARYRPKAILWHQGESDSIPGDPVPRSESFANMNAVVASLRHVSMTPWVVAINSTSRPAPKGYSEWPIRQAQRDIIATWPHVFEGPDTDTIRTPGEVEYLGPALEAHGRLWGQRLLQLGL